ncbi:erythrocyte membrane-associated antigen, putative [Plasmodium yoelii yoelii]|uniref:Erythrocyte membrane-associated antigen, putative n=1 Tax=Plasmodium yoelii yoelii TaxID=73239 RepID=Q7RBN0_PLAYO|nr:erythrocyte membrane-associated antigen, putative [Plasmodium yoelii yoelii]
MKTKGGLLLYINYAKYAIKASVKIIKSHIKDIREEINVKSFSKYKYNFLFEFIGSFIFVFLISVYMLNSNQNEEYIIKHINQINPYKKNDIFINELNLHNNDINGSEDIRNISDIKNINSINDMKLHEASTLLNQGNKQLKEQNDTSFEKNKISNTPKIENSIGEEKEKTIPNTNEDSTTIVNDNKREEDEVTNIGEKNVNTKNIDDTTINDDLIEKNEKINETTDIHSLPKDSNKEKLTKDVDEVIFKDKVNEYSKIKLDDINNMDLKKFDDIKILKDSNNKNNSNHAIYSFFGCLIYVLFIILGAHINPAYTYALWLIEPQKYGFVITTLYATFQYIGGILASILCAHIYGSIFIYSLLPRKHIMKTFLCEFVSTFLLTILLLSFYNYKKLFKEENQNEEEFAFNKDKIKNMSSLYSSHSFEDIYEYDIFNTYSTRSTSNNKYKNFGKIIQVIIFYIKSLPLWIGPYAGSACATFFMKLFKDNNEEIVNVIDTNVYNYNGTKEKMPLINTNNTNQNAYLEEYNDHICYNSNNYLNYKIF